MTNIVTAPIGANRMTKTRSIYQYNYGQVLVLTGIELPPAYEVHFSNSEFGVSKVQIGNSDGVTIPDEYLESGADIYAWLYLHTGADDGETVYKILIPVEKRASISPEEPTPVQQDAITQAIAALNAGVERAETAADNAEDSADSAAQSASEAAQYLESVQRAADSAQDYAESAQRAADSAFESAQDSYAYSEQSAAKASESALSANASSESADAARASELAAAQSAQAASGKAGEAAASATEAANSATQAISARNAAQGAANSAATAQTAAETAQDAAEAAADEVENSIEDAQDIVEAAETLMIFPAIGGAAASVATVTDAANDQPMALKIGIEPVQAGSGTPAPDNVRPITGWTGAGITCSGKNLLNPDMNAYDIKRYYRIMFGVVPWDKPAIMSFVEKDPSVDISNVSIGFVEDVYKESPALSPINFRWVISNGVVKDNKTNVSQIDNQTICTGIFIYPNTPDVFAQLFARFDIQVELGSVATAYEPYRNKNVYQVAFPSEAGTVYGGTLEIAQDGTGTLTVDKAYADLGTLDWGYNTSLSLFFSNLSNAKFYNSSKGGACICSAYDSTYSKSYSSWSAFPNENISCGNNYSTGAINLCVKDTQYTDAATFKTAMNGVQLVYELATPQTYTFTAEQVKSLLGINNVWADCGDTQITAYYADKTLLITAAEQRVENLTVSSETLPAGSPASVEKEESADGINLHFGIPKGADGQSGGVTDVQVNGSSVLNQGVANVPQVGASGSGQFGVVKITRSFGIDQIVGNLILAEVNHPTCKAGTNGYISIQPKWQHESTFYGLAKAAGDTTQSASDNPVGQYTDSAKSKISEMLSSPVTVTGTTPTITALSGIQYVCGEVATLDITLPESGIVDVVFQSGSTPTVLTITPSTGMTVEWANGFDSTSLDANTMYELNIKMVGSKCLGVAGTWT